MASPVLIQDNPSTINRRFRETILRTSFVAFDLIPPDLNPALLSKMSPIPDFSCQPKSAGLGAREREENLLDLENEYAQILQRTPLK